MKKTILVTGGAGFIGSHLIAHLLHAHPRLHILNLDSLTYAGSLKNLQSFTGNPRHTFIQGDICDAALLAQLFKQQSIRGVIHCAAESHVDHSIASPNAFIHTNVLGTYTLLEAARQHWLEAPGQYKPAYQGSRFHHISTDEVYGSLNDPSETAEIRPASHTGFLENTLYAPSSPYAASKASADHLVRAWHRTYGLDVTLSHSTNNYGPRQHGEKLIPTLLRKGLAEEPIPIYGTGQNIRDWLYVHDHCTAVDIIYHHALPGATYNIGACNERTNLQIARAVCRLLDQKRPRRQGSYVDLITHIPDRPGHDYRYAIDATKLETELGWRAQETFETGLEKTVDGYLEEGEGSS